MTRARRLCIAVIAAVVLVSCGGDGDARSARDKPKRKPSRASSPPAPKPTSALPECRKPKKVDYPEWVPADLPLPRGTYAYKNLPPLGGYERGLFVLELSTQQLIKHVLEEFPKAGYTLGRGDAEPGEVEDDFRKPPAVGAFKANDVFCSPGYSIMYLIYAPKGPKGVNVLPTPTSTGTPLR